MSIKDIWRNIPLLNTIINMLELKGGSLTDRELYEAVRMSINIGYPDFIKALMKLELNNIVKVSTSREGMLIVELRRGA